METNQKVYILLQQHKGFFANLYCILKKGKYNHASIGFCNNMSEFYSFRSKWGFCVEHPFLFNKEYKKSIKCSIYEIEITFSEYSKLKEVIKNFELNRTCFNYSHLSLILGFIGIKHKFMNGYYCSKFVAEVLEKSGALKLSKESSIYMPHDFSFEKVTLKFEGVAQEFQFA